MRFCCSVWSCYWLLTTVVPWATSHSVEFEFAQRSVFEVKTIDVKFAFSRGTGWFNQNAPILSATNSARNCYDANVTYLVSYIPP